MTEQSKGRISLRYGVENHSIQAVIQVLNETAEKFHSLEQEAMEALLSKRDTVTYKRKLVERAQLLINLPNLLSTMLERIDPEKKKRIMNDTECFAESAKKALIDDTRGFLLSSLLSHLGSGGKNDLEELIFDLDK